MHELFSKYWFIGPLFCVTKYRSSFPVSGDFVNVAHSANGPLVAWNSGGK